jgi:hypothetical protein
MADFHGFWRLARLMLPFDASGAHSSSGRQEMAKFEAFAFAFGFVATGVMTLFASVPLA